MVFDSHVHLDDERFDDVREELIASLKQNGVDYVINIGADMESSKASVLLSEKYDFIYAAVGVHPHDTASMTEDDILKLKELSKGKKVVAIGEIGLDYHYEGTDKEAQKKWFERQIVLAKELGLPVIVHSRDAIGDTLEILRKYKPKGVMHCFSASVESAREILDMGMYISFAGPITYKNSKKLIEAVKEVPHDKFLIETDCPYLPPEPHRGQRNTPVYVRLVAAKIAEILGLSFEEVCRLSEENTKTLFNI